MADTGISKEELIRLLTENRSVHENLDKQGYIGHDQLNNQYFSEAMKDLRYAITKNEEEFSKGADGISDAAEKLSKIQKGLDSVVARLSGAKLGGHEVNLNEWTSDKLTVAQSGKTNATTREERLTYGFLESYIKLTELRNNKQEELNDLQERQNNLAIEINAQRLLERKEAERLIKIETQGLTLLEKRQEALEKMGIKTQMVSNGWNEIKNSFNGILSIGKKLMEPFAKLDKATMNYARSMGISAKNALELRNSMLQVTSTTKGLTKLGFNTADLLEATAKYSASIGRRVTLNGSQELSYAAMTKFLGDEGTQNFAKGTDSYGLDMKEAANRVRDMFVTSENTGVAFETYSKNFVDNLKIAQSYTFSNGLRGLDAMAKRSAEIKLNIADVARVADKVSTLEGAMSAGAGLSVLGGSFAMYSNPLQMLYEGLNDMEALGERVEKIFAGSVFFDQKKGQLDMSSFDRQRMRAASQALGIDYNAMTEMAFSRGRRDVVAKQLAAAGITQDNAGYEKLLNQAFLDKNGKAMVNIKGEEYSVADVAKNSGLLSILSRTSDNDSKNLETIAQTLLNWDEKIIGIQKGVEEQMASNMANSGIGDKMKDMLDFVADNSETVANIYQLLMAMQALLMVGGIGNGLGNFGRGLFSGKGGGGAVGGGTVGGAAAKTTKIPSGAFKNGATAGGGRYRYESGIHGWREIATGKKVKTDIALGAGVDKRGFGLNGKAIGGAALGIGTVASLAGSVFAGSQKAKYANATDEEGLSKGANWGTAQGAFNGFSQGAMWGSIIGSAIPGVGTIAGGLIGGGIGALAGGFSAYDDENKAKYAKLISYRSGHELQGDYSLGELEDMYNRPDSLSNTLKSKIAKSEGISNNAYEISKFLGKEIKAYRRGGVVRGTGTGTSDSNLAWLSNNEYVMPAVQVSKPNNRAILDSMRNGDNLIPRFANGGIVSPIKNSLKSMKVSEKSSSSRGGTVGEVKVAPINITGTIKLDLNGTTKDIDANKLLNNTMFTKQLTDMIARNLNKQLNYGYDKNSFYKKF